MSVFAVSVFAVDIPSKRRIMAAASPSSPARVLSFAKAMNVHSQEKIMSLRKLASNLAGGVAYPGHRHFAKRLLSRRGFLERSGITLGALAASGLVPGLARAAASKTHGINSTTSATPLPIPGGLQLLGPG